MVFNLLNSRLQKFVFEKPTKVQLEAIPQILKGSNVLIVAPTGSGKTEAAFLPVLSMYLNFKVKFGFKPGIYIIYITPLRALNRDMFKRLIKICNGVGVSVNIRHGDTSRSVRRMQARNPPEVLITTPETLQAILPSKGMRKWLRSVKWIIVDEIHDLIESKRGAQLSIGLERLKINAESPIQLIGLSATISDLEAASKFMGDGDVKIIHVEESKPYSFRVEFPIPREEDYNLSLKLMCKPSFAARLRRIMELIETSTSTLIFVNCREFAEFISSRLRLAGLNIFSHHSSLSRKARELVEAKFKGGEISAVVCTSSLELGIDIGRIDLVVQYLSPRQVKTLIQRVGRSGHFLEKVSRGVVLNAGFDDLIESMVIVDMALNGRLEHLKIHRNALDVLAHQIVGIILDFNGKVEVQKIYSIVKLSHPFEELEYEVFMKVLKYMEGLGLIKIEGKHAVKTRRSRAYYYRHLSTIPEEVTYPVIDESTGEEVAHLGEDFFSEYGKLGVKIILRGRPWIISRIEGFNIYVKPVDDYTAAIPGWEGEALPTSWTVARSVGKLRRLVEKLWRNGYSALQIAEKLSKNYPVELKGLEEALKPLLEYLDQGFPMPHDGRIVIEGFGPYIIIHSCSGHGVNRCIARIVGDILKRKFKSECTVRWDAYRILIMASPEIEPRDVEEILTSIRIGDALNIIRENVDPYIIRHVAIKFDALPKGTYYKSASYLLHLPEIFKDTPIFEEAFRFQLTQHYDFENFKKLLDQIRSGRVEVVALNKSSTPTSIGKPIVEFEDLLVTDDNQLFLERIRRRVLNFLCLDCLHTWRILCADYRDGMACPKCSSPNISLVKWKVKETVKALLKKRSEEELSEEEESLIAYAKMSADLIKLYGEKAVLALSTRGVGPLTAYQILAKMHRDLDDLIDDLREAMKEYLETRDFWEA